MRSRAGEVASLVLTVALVASACTGEAEPERNAQPRFEAAECPTDVELLVIQEHTCGEVVAHRDSGLEVRVFVLIVEPPTPSESAPILETGTDLGATPTYGGLAPVAQRTGRRTVIVDLPGVGHSQPSLDCPEVRALQEPSASETADLVAAITTCRRRVEEAGARPDEMTTAGLAEDLAAVMTALEAPRWVLMGHGTTASAAIEVARIHPDRVEALVLDSPVQSDARPAERLDRIVEDVASECRADTTCRDSYSDVERLWRLAHRRVAQAPLAVRPKDASVSIDPAGLDRVVRWLVAPASIGPSKLPELLTEVVAGRPGQLLRSYATIAAAAPPLCLGYLPKCEAADQLAHGAVLSNLCPTVAGQATWREHCRAWGIAADTSSVKPVRGVPVLAMYGRYDPFAAPADVRRELRAQVPDAFVVEDPVAGHNVLANDCMRSIRNAWLAGDPRQPPPEPPCLTDHLTFD
jgi:pimeloyl-ACP methyl ester carboxylesterase